ncbi:MAG: hypothetical protein OEZ47_09090, partial [Gammaproteobacteria bacterium]|nr:hypothetical protein [Gammaproteobacteria bacterium]
LILLAGVSQELYAWNFIEHRELGEKAFIQACDSLVTDHLANTDKFEPLSVLRAVPCVNPITYAKQFGLRSALSGDHIEDPESFSNADSEIQALSLTNYGLLALGNHQHFWPHVKKAWREAHDRAIAYAEIARKSWLEGRSVKAIQEFDQALIYSAFASHFLQDSFSVGHNGFSRMNSTQNSSLILHDEWNSTGRYFKGFNMPDSAMDTFLSQSQRTKILNNIFKSCAANRTMEKKCDWFVWHALGDGKLNEDAENQKRILLANESSIKAVMMTFVYGNDHGYSFIADLLLPVSTEHFTQNSAYGSILADSNWLRKMMLGKAQTRYEVRTPIGDKCFAEDESVYFQSGHCWVDLENSYMEPVYPDLSIALTGSSLPTSGGKFVGIYLAYNIYTTDWFSWWPKYVRVYYHSENRTLYEQLNNKDIAGFDEIGFNFAVPNFYRSSVLSHDIQIAYAELRYTDGSDDFFQILSSQNRDRGAYAGLNTNVDFLKYKFSFGLGYFFPDTDAKNAVLRASVSIGKDFGVVGGGPLTRWE